MPFEKKINTAVGVIGIWKLNDSSDTLLEQCKLSISDQHKFNKITFERRKREFLASRILIEILLERPQEVSYNNSGKPYLKGTSQNISISHSADFATVFISEKKIGIDVEQTTRNIDRVAPRFLHPDETKFIAKLENQQNAKILFWSAKEAIFKCTEFQGIQFNQQIFVPPFQLKSKGCFNGNLQLNNKTVNYKLHYFFFKNNVIVYCVEQ